MIEITLKQIWDEGPCRDGWDGFAAYHNTLTFSEMEELEETNFEFNSDVYQKFPLLDVMTSNDIYDTLWCLNMLQHWCGQVMLTANFIKEVAHFAPHDVYHPFMEVYRFIKTQVEEHQKDQPLDHAAVAKRIKKYAAPRLQSVDQSTVFLADSDDMKTLAYKTSKTIRRFLRVDIPTRSAGVYSQFSSVDAIMLQAVTQNVATPDEYTHFREICERRLLEFIS